MTCDLYHYYGRAPALLDMYTINRDDDDDDSLSIAGRYLFHEVWNAWLSGLSTAAGLYYTAKLFFVSILVALEVRNQETACISTTFEIR